MMEFQEYLNVHYPKTYKMTPNNNSLILFNNNNNNKFKNKVVNK